MEIKKIAVLGAGSMGGGIAQVAAQAGFDVILSDIDRVFVDRAIGRIDSFLSKSVEKGKMSAEQKDAVIGRIIPTTGMDLFVDADLVIEAIIEDLEMKKEAFSKMDQVCKPETYLTTNTSSMSITMIAAITKRPDKVAGMHFFNPAPIMRLVEVIRGYYTSNETVQVVSEVAAKMGKTTVEVKKDSPGFIVNRVFMAHLIESMRLVEEGVATMEDIDTAIKLGLNYPMGPFELQDFAGVEITHHVANYFCEEFKDMRWNSPQILKDLVRAGRLGRKTGAGFYDYNDKK
ncbi:3-hydroxyacyl-CoA dehydrogenase family protein [Desulfoscipio gibsoniae]|uniref:3-hydroxybutyryl-CoA dehydrogenase n=1 Tax=Desulfoscipio gibsoniae DSM 7213 TaxID=767817 RepID=R4KA76_9FIRM|nr:3-hydroxyacyl-CoA dehydrogenase family protein [Desulfoscipio gibsoniae]AGL00068.1 3-hydroxyacyl-CoA dehydrogenase [Desulfoscipio gibsoniae DSM 7213]